MKEFLIKMKERGVKLQLYAKNREENEIIKFVCDFLKINEFYKNFRVNILIIIINLYIKLNNLITTIKSNKNQIKNRMKNRINKRYHRMKTDEEKKNKVAVFK